MYINAKNVVLRESAATNSWATGTSGRETQVGTARNDVFHGTAGDTLIGGAGDDAYNLWNGDFTITEQAGEGIDTVYANIWGAVTLSANVENLFLQGDGAKYGTGNSLNNIIVASTGGSTLDGKGGDDVLVGGARGDLFKIAAGNGSDAIVNFVSGSDSIQLQGYGVTSFNQLMSLAVQDGADVRFTMNNGELLVLRDLNLSSLKAYDFGFRDANIAGAGETTLAGAGRAINANGWYTFNNVWNSNGLVENRDFFIESTTNPSNMSRGTTFTWTFPVTTQSGAPVRAYPEIIFGPAPMGGGQKASDVGGVFPLQVSSLASLDINYDVSITGNRSGFNVAFDIWLTNAPGASGAAAVTNEIMIWAHTGDFPAFGTVVGTYVQDGVTFTIYHMDKYTAFVANTDQFKATIDFAAMLDKLIALGIVSPNEYLASVELGSEVFSGTGSLTIHNLDISATTHPVNGVGHSYFANGSGTTVTEIFQPISEPAPDSASPPLAGAAHEANFTSAATGVTADLLTPASNLGAASGQSLVGITDLGGSAFNDVLNGNAVANILTGGAGNDLLVGREGADVLEGGEGDDRLQGDAGADTLRGGAGIDTATYDRAAAGVTVDLTTPSANTGEALGDSYESIENLSGSAFDDTLAGDIRDNTLSGQAGNDVLRGRAGNDLLEGGAGADRLYGDAGDDVLQGDAGDDMLVGGLGADRLVGGAGADTAGYQSSAGGVRADLQNASTNTGEAAGDTYESVENLLGSGSDDILGGNIHDNTLAGGNGNDSLLGRGGNDLLDGNDGNDRLDGGEGNDILRGGAGADLLTGGAGADRLEGGTGIDEARYNLSLARVTVDLVSQSSNTGDAAGDTFVDIENLLGSAFNDILRGDDAINVLNGSAGDDSLYGRGGNDRLIGGAGADLLDGGAGFDMADYASAAAGVSVDLSKASLGTGDAAGDRYISIEGVVGSLFNDSLWGDQGANYLMGGAGADTLAGRDGDDTLRGGQGSDVLTGGQGADRFLFAAGDDRDTITDFQHGVDRISLSRSAFGLDSITGEERALTSADVDFLTSGSVATSGRATFFWNSATGVLRYDADGNGAGKAVTLASLTPGTTLTLSDIHTINDQDVYVGNIEDIGIYTSPLSTTVEDKEPGAVPTSLPTWNPAAAAVLSGAEVSYGAPDAYVALTWAPAVLHTLQAQEDAIPWLSQSAVNHLTHG